MDDAAWISKQYEVACQPCVRLTCSTDLLQFNMPFECGVFYGARRFGATAQARKRFLLLDKEPIQHQKTMSDAAGLDQRAR
jgi:hypothetical protein